jgi:hypothetical protein
MQNIDKFLAGATANTYIRATLTVLLLFYGSLAAGSLPPFLRQLFKNPIFRIFIIALTAYVISKDLQVGVLVATVFMLSIVGMNRMENNEMFQQLEHLAHIERFKAEQERE